MATTMSPLAREGGAAAALVERVVDADLPQVVVADSRRALGLAAAQWRARFVLPVIAVAGSNGKTTVTQMIASILATAHGDKGRLATRGNLNNDIGVPLMLWQLSRQHRAAVFELGMNHVGEIAYLAGLVRPTVALVNNAQREHQEFMRSVEATAYENGEVIAALPLSDDGVAVFPADDPCTSIWRQIAGTRRVVDFAIEADAVVTATYTLRADGARVSMATPLGLVDVDLAVTGVHNVRNALAAAACAIGAGIDAGSIVEGLRAFRPVAGRGVRLSTIEGSLLIDDTYNANPDSVRAAIDLLAGFEGERVLVLGDMGEVGERGPEFHREVGPMRASAASTDCSRSARWRSMPWTRSARAPCTAPPSIPCWLRCGRGSVRRSRCSSRDRGSCGWSASCRRWPPRRRKGCTKCCSSCSNGWRRTSARSTSSRT